MTLVLDAGAIAAEVAHIDEDGYTVIEDAIEPELVAELRDTIRRLERELDVAPRGTAAEGHSTLRMYNLLAKDPVFQAMPVHPSVLPIVERLLDRGCLLSGMTAIDIGPGEHAQPMHGDDVVMSRHLAPAARADDGHEHLGAHRLHRGERRHAVRPRVAPAGPARPPSPDRAGRRRRPLARDAGRQRDGLPRQPLARRRRQHARATTGGSA